MQVGAGDASGGANFAEDGAALDRVALLYRYGRQVAVERVDAEAVVDYDRIASVKEIVRQRDAAALSGVDGSAGRRRHIYSGVRRAWLPVQHAAAAEVSSGVRASEGNAKGAVPEAFGRSSRVDVAKALAFFFSASFLFRVRLDEFLSDLEFFNGEFTVADGNGGAARDYLAAAVRQLGGESYVVRTYRRIEIDPEQGVLGARNSRLRPQRERVIHPVELGFRERLCASDFDAKKASLRRGGGAEAKRNAIAAIVRDLSL